MFKSFFKKLFGTKQDKDKKFYLPAVEQTNAEWEQLQGLSNDELRNKTQEFRQRILDHLSGIDEDIKAIQEQTAVETDLQEKEALFKQIDELKKERDKELEKVLKVLLPEAFAVVKETAKRFAENDSLTVTATDHDRDLSLIHI